MIFYVEAHYGCGIRQYEDEAEAEREALLDMGRDNFVACRPATLDDVQHVNSMGGWLPEEAENLLVTHNAISGNAYDQKESGYG